MFVKTKTLRTTKYNCFIDITHLVEQVVKESNINNGQVMVFIPHTTAAVTINENADDDVVTDMVYGLSKMVPDDASFRHLEGNSVSHIKASIIGPSITVIVQNNQLLLGTWQGVYFCEFDGPRERIIHMQVIGSAS